MSFPLGFLSLQRRASRALPEQWLQARGVWGFHKALPSKGPTALIEVSVARIGGPAGRGNGEKVFWSIVYRYSIMDWGLLSFFLSFLVFLPFLGPFLRHMEVPRLGV